MNFKAQMERDLTAVFHNSTEHADELEFWISGTRYKAPVVLDNSSAKNRKQLSSDHVDGLFLVDLVLYVPLSVLKRTPRKGESVEIGDDFFTIREVHSQSGEIVLYLEMLSE